MGMSASQMRYCMLTGKKSDVEFQGQQINQQRTTLATETSAYNAQLLNLVVPTPPSSDAYTTTSYTFSSNGQERNVTGTVYDSVPTSPTYGKYTINYSTEQIASQGESNGTSLFVFDGIQYKSNVGNVLTPAITDPMAPGYSALDAQNISLIEKDCGIAKYSTTIAGAAVNLRTITTDSSSIKYSAADVANLQSIYGASYDQNKTYYKYNTGAGTVASPIVPHYVDASTMVTAGATATATSYTAGQVVGVGGTPLTLNETQFYTYLENGSKKYVTQSDLATYANTITAMSTYDVNPNATVTNNAKMTGCEINWSTSGRMSAITDAEGNEYSLNVVTKNDNEAYDNAYNEYEYQKNLYSQEMDNINSKIDIVESQDKKLELKLKDLDTQQQALSTEMDSVKKVVDKNIEASFKAFA